MPNRLSRESSPYLLQHANNPVDWYPWGNEALQKAKSENKPILVSIGYAACHWCHVMERESFENEATAALMNEHFINIKIDREERPDLDHIYMDAVQAMTGSGGWPLNVFLTPDAKPFYGGTYFPPRQMYNRPSWTETLMGVSETFKQRRHEVDAQAENLTEHLLQSNQFGQQKNEDAFFSSDLPGLIAQNILKNADKEWGGFGKAPKFPQSFCIRYLLRYYHVERDQASLDQALLSIDKMIEGGIYDQVGGGFARYSTDTEWLAPHFEKMLYDNALLVAILSEAFLLTRKKRYREVIDETITFITREMKHPGKGFYSALDADSEGVEGKFYVWSLEEINEILGKDAEIFCAYYDVTAKGNWEHANILRVLKPLEQFAAENNLEPGALEELLAGGRKKLLKKRGKRIRPQLDDKIILGWNALMNTALSMAFAATGNESYRQLAVENMRFLVEKLGKGETFHHTWKNDEAKFPAFLDDYAFLVQALLHLQEITGDRGWLEKAVDVTDLVIRDFSEEGTGFFYFTGVDQDDVIVRKKEVYDGAVPSGNSVMAMNLLQLALLLDRPEWRERGREMMRTLGNAIVKYPTSFGNWAMAVLEQVDGVNEIVVMGPGMEDLHREVLGVYMPHRVLMAAEKEDSRWPLLAGREEGSRPAIYRCSNYTCQLPVFSAKELISLINKGQKG